MRNGVAIVGLVLIAMGWMNATLSDRHPGLLIIGCVLVLTSRRWSSRDLGIAAGGLGVPLLYWFYMAGFHQGPICSEESGCHESWAPPDVVMTVIELVPCFVIGWLAWRLGKHDPLASGPVVPAREGAL